MNFLIDILPCSEKSFVNTKAPNPARNTASGASKLLKHSALKLPKIALPLFDGSAFGTSTIYYNLLFDTLQYNYGDRTAIKNAQCIALVAMGKPQHSATALRAFCDSIISDMRSLTTLDLLSTRYGDFYVPVLLEKLPEKLLTSVLKEYPNANPNIDLLMGMIHYEVKKA